MYMLLKHLVDRYNMYYAYLPSKLDKKIHSGAVTQVVAAPILCLFWLLFFSTVRTFETPTSMFTLVVLIVTIVVCLSHVCFGHFKYLSAHNYKIDTKETDPEAVENGRPARPSSSSVAKSQQMYIAQVLQDPTSDEAGGGSSEEDRGSSQDEEMLNGGNSINEADFQSGEDSLIANEVHQ
uniref:CSC1/OSCA1-like 7TM region domain-containing protein n=1 Tax=Oryzias latipes TaxID=8090 RepID=A0A3B3HI38_ORYLA